MRVALLILLFLTGQEKGVIWVEAEFPVEQKGSQGEDRKFGACGLQCLGMNWGARSDHFAEYRVTLPEALDARLHLRYARAMEGPAKLDVGVDGTKAGALDLPATGGWGEKRDTWRLASINLGNLSKGDHTIRFQSAADQNNVNLDGFAVTSQAVKFVVDEAFWRSKLPEDMKRLAGGKAERRELNLDDIEIPKRVHEANARDILKGLEYTAKKPQPYLVKAYDAGAPTDFDHDVVWHLLTKERDPRFKIPQAGKLGVIDLISDIAVTVNVEAPECDAHLLDAYAAHGKLSEVLILPVSSDTILFVIRGVRRATVTISKEECDLLPTQRYGYGATTTAGRMRWAGHNEVSGSMAACYDDWNPGAGRLTGSTLCAISGSFRNAGGEFVLEGMTGASLTFQFSGNPLVVAATLRRIGKEKHLQQNGMEMYANEDVAAVLRRNVEALSTDWPAQLRASAKRYAELPRVTLPRKSWESDFLSCLELPLANTFSPCRQMKRPFYNFCRAHAHEPYGWWSYGMHAHESLSTFITNMFRPGLSQEWLSGHLDLQFESGEYPYGVNPKGRRKEEAWGAATAPFIPWEAWTAYGWSGDKEFLARAYESGVKNHEWWMSKARTRTDVPLQRWLNFMETVRDDMDLTTWTYTGGAENQEALDLNCYMLVQERTLARMAEELGRDGKRFAKMAERRAAAMKKHMWGGDAYYGVDLVKDRLVKVKDISTFFPLWAELASKEEAEKIVAHLRDPKKFASAWPVPTLAMDEPRYGAQWHWHGSNWVETSLLVMQGLRAYGYYEDAARLAEVNCRMVFETLEATGHFREYFNTETGKPTDLTDYIWTALPATMIVEVIFGVRATAEGLEIKPALPKGWDDIKLENLNVRGKRVTVVVNRSASAKGTWIKWSDVKEGATIEVAPMNP